MAQMPELETHRKGRDVLLAFSKDVGPVLSHSIPTIVKLLSFLKLLTSCATTTLTTSPNSMETFHEGCIDNTLEGVGKKTLKLVGKHTELV